MAALTLALQPTATISLLLTFNHLSSVPITLTYSPEHVLHHSYYSLYTKARILGHKRGKRNSRPNQSIIQIEGVDSKEDARAYLGKRVAYVYKAKRVINGSKIRVIWGRVSRPHGNSGKVKSKFRSNLPAKLFGASCRVMLYPSNI
ncbi:50S small subunit ribosomal protein L33-b [Tremella mesenterica]|uniref:50S small subunit ribosomal protein L33-b n=1 Tax=Tremella mesenterica TaxID=5217 RepID=A0A4V1M435_TREME|nr:50S small subunit ribosomal protein L33-b [Tremella mesenterica]